MENLVQNGNLPKSIHYGKHAPLMTDGKLLQPSTYITGLSDNTVIIKLPKAFNYWLNIPEEKLAIIESFADTFENFQLVYNDVRYNSTLRPNIPTANSIYGTPLTINAAMHIFSFGLKQIRDFDHPEATRFVMDQLLEFFRGQGTELLWCEGIICPTEEEYNQMATKKMGSLLFMITGLMQLYSENKEDYTKLVSILGLSLQIIEDYKTWYLGVECKIKNGREYRTERKFTFPLIHAIQSNPDNEQIMFILRQHTEFAKFKEYCAGLLQDFGSLEYTKKKLKELQMEAMQELKKFTYNPLLETAIEYIFKDVV